jgi:hypothetical protein
MWLCVGILLLGGVFVAGLYALRPRSPVEPAGVVDGVPKRTLRVVTWQVLNLANDEIIDELKPINPDIVLLQGVNAKDVPAIVGALQMSSTYYPANYQPTQRTSGTESEFGTLIVSKFGLYDARQLRTDRGCCGVRAICVVDGRAFGVASVDRAAGGAKGNELLEVANRPDLPLIVADLGRLDATRQWTVDRLEARHAIARLLQPR